MQYKHFDAVAQTKKIITILIESALNEAVSMGELPDVQAPAFVVEIPADTSHGDYATNVAMAGAKSYHMAPRQVAEIIIQHLQTEGSPFEKTEIAGPGFINFFVREDYFADVVKAVLEQHGNYGRTNVGQGKKYNVEFVSANPTGPMHLGNARGGVLGDTLAETLNWAGYNATREFLINDAGNQIVKFGKSLAARYMQHFLGEENVPFPEDGYQGEDIKVRAQEYIALHADNLVNMPEGDRCDILTAYALPKNVENMRSILEKYRVIHEIWFSEQTLHESGAVQETIELLTKRGYTYEKDDALWYKATAFGAEKDEVLVRRNGISTYFAADIAYHYNKFAVRGFDTAIDVWGADHHGHVARMKGAMDAIGLNGDKLDVVLMQLVHLVRGGEQVRMSKRTGKAITLVDLLEEVPVDAARFFFNMREPTSHMDFDLDLAVAQNSENPVYYVQYAHARICSIIKALSAESITFIGAEKIDYTLLKDPAEVELIRNLSYFPGEIVAAAQGYDPARITRYVLDLATQFHKFYTACRVRNEDTSLMQSRLALCIATQTVLANALTILKISIPETM